MSGPFLNQSQKQTQSLTIAPQLQNSLKILQSASFDLRTAILFELQRNPLLEELPIEGVSVEAESELIQENGDSRNEELDFDSDDFSILEKMSDDYMENHVTDAVVSGSDLQIQERRDHFLNSLRQEESLQQHLIDQITLCDCDDATKENLILLIGSLDENGYLNESSSNLSLQLNIPYPKFLKALEILKTFNPAGIGAKDLQECLLIQLKRINKEDTLAYTVIEKTYPLLLRRRIQEIAKKLKVTDEAIQKALEDVANMDPSPGKRFSADTNSVIEADIKIFFEDEIWKIELNNEYIPKLRISQKYKDLLAQGNLSKKEKEYLIENMRSGKFLINSLGQRQNTLKKISEKIIEHQPKFFVTTNPSLRPMTMQEIAEDIGVHETTISRAIANKYVKTPHGLFPLKHFFNSGFTSDSGESIANRSIKETIEKIIQKEDSHKPISDQGIVKELEREGIKIARRTVAKYREQQGILPTHLRRRFD
ncbi:MAG: RNA polymerase factor sigma-54 [Opitutae bacterium]|nr:RNA polymerase factor sigma-54 [Opitutae bacterium]